MYLELLIICGYLNFVTFVLIISDVEHGAFNKCVVPMHYCVAVLTDLVLTCKQPLTRLELAANPLICCPLTYSQARPALPTPSEFPQVLMYAPPAKVTCASSAVLIPQ